MMIKILLAVLLALSGCSNIQVSGTMCDQVQRGANASLPQECQAYDEKKADDAFHKVADEKKVSDKDIKFDKEEEE